jgi:hypothetical protein
MPLSPMAQWREELANVEGRKWLQMVYFMVSCFLNSLKSAFLLSLHGHVKVHSGFTWQLQLKCHPNSLSGAGSARKTPVERHDYSSETFFYRPNGRQGHFVLASRLSTPTGTASLTVQPDLFFQPILV